MLVEPVGVGQVQVANDLAGGDELPVSSQHGAHGRRQLEWLMEVLVICMVEYGLVVGGHDLKELIEYVETSLDVVEASVRPLELHLARLEAAERLERVAQALPAHLVLDELGA